MESSLTEDKLNHLHSLLDRELGENNLENNEPIINNQEEIDYLISDQKSSHFNNQEIQQQNQQMQDLNNNNNLNFQPQFPQHQQLQQNIQQQQQQQQQQYQFSGHHHVKQNSNSIPGDSFQIADNSNVQFMPTPNKSHIHPVNIYTNNNMNTSGNKNNYSQDMSLNIEKLTNNTNQNQNQQQQFQQQSFQKKSNKHPKNQPQQQQGSVVKNELQQLQDKILGLEKKIQNINSPAKQSLNNQLQKQKLSQSSPSHPKETFGSADKKIIQQSSIQQNNFISQQQQQQQQQYLQQIQNSADSQEYEFSPPLKQKYKQINNQKCYTSKQLDFEISNLHNSNNYNNQNSKRQQKKRSSSLTKMTPKTNQQINNLYPNFKNNSNKSSLNNQGKKRSKSSRSVKIDLEKQIQDAENKLVQQQSKYHSSNNSNKQSFSKRNLTPKSSTSTNQLSSYHQSLRQTTKDQGEINLLNKKVMQYKKGWEEERSKCVQQRQKNQQLQEQNQRQEMKIKKLEIQLDKISHLEIDYNKLLQNFEKSEYIRNQQKSLIHNLNLEIQNLQQNQGILQKKKSKKSIY